MLPKIFAILLVCSVSTAASAQTASRAIRDAKKTYEAELAELNEKYEERKKALLDGYRESLTEAMKEASEKEDLDGIDAILKAIRKAKEEGSGGDKVISTLKKEARDLTLQIKQYEEAIGPVVAVLRWGHKGRKWGTEVLLEGGQTLSSREGTWKLENGALIFHWPSSRAPGGAWIDTLKLSEDRRKMAGTNQVGDVRLEGKLVGARQSWFSSQDAKSDK